MGHYTEAAELFWNLLPRCHAFCTLCAAAVMPPTPFLFSLTRGIQPLPGSRSPAPETLSSFLDAPCHTHSMGSRPDDINHPPWAPVPRADGTPQPQPPFPFRVPTWRGATSVLFYIRLCRVPFSSDTWLGNGLPTEKLEPEASGFFIGDFLWMYFTPVQRFLVDPNEKLVLVGSAFFLRKKQHGESQSVISVVRVHSIPSTSASRAGSLRLRLCYRWALDRILWAVRFSSARDSTGGLQARGSCQCGDPSAFLQQT